MNKIIVLFFLFFAFAFSSVLENKIIQYIGHDQYNKNKNIINVLFQNQNKFFLGGELNSVAILEELKNNGLLKLTFLSPKDLTLEFELNNLSVSSVYIIQSILSSMGYQYYFIKSIERNSQDNLLTISVVLNTEYTVDPIILSKELINNNAKIKDIIKKRDDLWSYKIDVQNMVASNSIKVMNNEKITLPKPLKPYLIQIDSASEINIGAQRLDSWFPYVVFYDKNFNPLYVIEKDTTYSGLKSAIPSGTKYIQIGDLYNLVNIKRGLTLVIKG